MTWSLGRMVGLLVASVGLILARHAHADLLAYDQFVGYSDGQLVDQGRGAGWSGPWEGEPSFTVLGTDSLEYPYLPGLATGGVAQTGNVSASVRRELATPLDEPGTYYLGFLMRMSGTPHNAVLGLSEPAAGSGQLAYGGAWNSGSRWVLARRDGIRDYGHVDTGVAETQNTTLFVLKLQLSGSSEPHADKASLFINPSSAAALEGNGNAAYWYDFDFPSVSYVVAGLYNQGQSVGTFAFDEIRVGTEAADMFSLIPEPTPLALLALAALLPLCRRFRYRTRGNVVGG